MNKTTKAFSADITPVEGERAVTAVVSTTAVDRDGEVMIPQGLNSKDYEANPILCFMHDYYGTLPVGKCVGLKRGKSEVTAKFVFADRPETHPEGQEWLPDTLLSLYQQGVMKGFSVGFLPAEVRPATPKDMADYGEKCRKVISKWNLLEISAVVVPCNQEAVALAVSKGLKSETAKALFGYEAKAGEPEKPEDEEKAEPHTCADCGEECPDDQERCEACAGKAEPAEEPKHVVASVEMAEAEPVKHVHVVLTKTATKVSVRKIMLIDAAKKRGRMYVK